MTRKTKYILVIAWMLIFCLVFNEEIFSQNNGFVDVVGEITHEKEINGAFARLVQGNKPVDSLFLSWDGQYDFRLELNKNYYIEFKKAGLAPHRILLSTSIPKKEQHKVWTIKPTHKLSNLRPDNTGYIVLANIVYYETKQGGGFFDKNDTSFVKIVNKGKTKTEVEMPDLTNLDLDEGQEEENEGEEMDSILADLLADGILEEAPEPEVVDDVQLKQLEEGIEKLKDKSKQDSLLLFEKSIEIQNELLSNARYQLELSRLNAKSRSDSLGIKERERRIQLAEQEIENAKNRLKLKNYEIKNQRIIVISSVSGLILVLILLFILYSNFKDKKKLSKKLELQNKTLEVQGKGLEKANSLLSMQNLEITASISYAKRIQDAILPSTQTLQQYVQDIFILFKPKDIVSGDFYWTEKVDDTIFFAVVDCTGHGVPGAFMSIIGNRLLNEIIYTKQIYDPKALLEALDKGVKHTLQQDVTENNDGMDVCLIKIEPIKNERYKITFSGAKRPIFYYIKELEELKTLKGDRKPIGGKYYQEVQFTNKEIILSKDDILYLTSDGIIDQNGPDMKKLGTRKFVEILSQNASQTLEEQNNILEFELDTHQQGEDQRDDITIIGIKL